jgi:UDP-N-acetylmuramoyl-L-alanyl-D-glutamate--2,6-diaminopimelate ligase
MIALPSDLRGITADSRAVEPGYLFAALPGSHADGRRFIPDALARGAVAVLAAQGPLPDQLPQGVELLQDPNPRRALALMAAAFFGAGPRTVAAVTGTNGKTSVAEFTRQLWRLLGLPAASVGTLGLVGDGVAIETGHTTPDPVSLYRNLARLAMAGIDHLAIEASSHGLDQHRLDGLTVRAAAFTNLSRDHLDYHADLEAYFLAKRRLFTDLLARDGVAVVDMDDPFAPRVAAAASARGCEVLGYGRAGNALRIDAAEPRGDGTAVTARVLGRRVQLMLALVGPFQIDNAFAALGLVIGCGADPVAATAALEQLRGVRGRLEQAARHPSGAPIYVDYAHTPDAIETALRALRVHTRGRLVVVFGAGGDRDRGKRPLMGAAAMRGADLVFVTDDNPRSEEPAAIRAEIMAAAPGATEIGGRAAAISAAVAVLKADDVLLIAGKGHERGQIVGDRVLPFDDADAARAAVAELGSRS